MAVVFIFLHSLCASVYIPPLQHTTHYTGEQPCWLINTCTVPLLPLFTRDRLGLNVGNVYAADPCPGQKGKQD